jgi:DNA-binding NtrC family response regulator
MALVLIVDDCEPDRHTLRRMLESRQHRVVMAEGRLEGLELWRQRGADLVMLDLQLPDRDAIDTVVQFRAAAPELPIIAMASGDRSGLDVLADAYLLGVKAVLPKPFHLHQVLDLVARVLGTDEASEAG